MSTDLVVTDNALAPATLFGTDNPAEVVERAAKVARTLEQLVRQQKLIVRIGQSDHVRVEGWTLLGSMLGVFPVVEWTRPVLDGDEPVGWEARVEARTRAGDVVGAAEAECLRSERTWKGRDDYALRSMAQTRAVSKALRLPLGFVMQLAGFDPTPAEEMPVIEQRAPAHAPFVDGDDGLFPPPGVDQGLTAAHEKHLNMLVGQLRKDGHLATEHLWRACGLDPELGRGEDGELHWSPLRARLTDVEGVALIERLSKLKASVEKKPFEIPEAARQ